MRRGSVAKRYTTALIGVAQEQGKVDEYYEQLLAIQQVLTQDVSLRNVMASPVIAHSKKKAIFNALASKLGAGPILRNLIHILIDNERIPDLPLISLIYRDMADELKGRIRVEVTVAVPLGNHEAKLKSILEKTLRQEVLLEVKTDPEILGGLLVRVQDRIFDASLQGELERLKESMTVEAVT